MSYPFVFRRLSVNISVPIQQIDPVAAGDISSSIFKPGLHKTHAIKEINRFGIC